MPSITSSHKRKAFTLTELAIVLGIIGLILGAIWTAAAKVYQNNRIAKATNETLSIASSVRAIFSSKGTFGAAGGTFTTFGVNAGFFPPDMLPGVGTCYGGPPCPVSPWNQPVVLKQQTSLAGEPSNPSMFDIWFNVVPANDCPALVASVLQQAQSSGLVSIYYNNGGNVNLAVTSTTAVTSVGACSGNVMFTFSL